MITTSALRLIRRHYKIVNFNYRAHVLELIWIKIKHAYIHIAKRRVRYRACFLVGQPPAYLLVDPSPLSRLVVIADSMR